MKLILTHEVTGLGSPGDVVEVKDGYGRNYLVPRGLAIRWTKGGEKQVSTIKRAREVREVRDLDHAQEAKAKLASLRVKLPARAGDAGPMFGSVQVPGGRRIDKRRLELGTPIKTLGTHLVSVKLHPEVSASVSVEIVPA